MTERPPENVRQALALYEVYFGGGSLAPSARCDPPRALLGPVDLVDAAGQEVPSALGADAGVDAERVLPGGIPTHGKNVSRGDDIV